MDKGSRVPGGPVTVRHPRHGRVNRALSRWLDGQIWPLSIKRHREMTSEMTGPERARDFSGRPAHQRDAALNHLAWQARERGERE